MKQVPDWRQHPGAGLIPTAHTRPQREGGSEAEDCRWGQEGRRWPCTLFLQASEGNQEGLGLEREGGWGGAGTWWPSFIPYPGGRSIQEERPAILQNRSNGDQHRATLATLSSFWLLPPSLSGTVLPSGLRRCLQSIFVPLGGCVQCCAWWLGGSTPASLPEALARDGLVSVGAWPDLTCSPGPGDVLPGVGYTIKY